MSETHFTKVDWCPGKRRRTYPRVQAYGGQKQAPAAFLAAGRLAGLHTNRAARCTRIALSTGKPCRRVAMKGTTLCLVHGGAGVAKWLRPYVPTKRGQRVKAERALGGGGPKKP